MIRFGPSRCTHARPSPKQPPNKKQCLGAPPSAKTGVNSENNTTCTAFQDAAKTLVESIPEDLFAFFETNLSIKVLTIKAVQNFPEEIYEHIPKNYKERLKLIINDEKKNEIPEIPAQELITLLTKPPVTTTNNISNDQKNIFFKYIPARLVGNLSLNKLKEPNTDPDFLIFTDNIKNLEIALETLQKVLQETNPNQEHQKHKLPTAIEAIKKFRKSIIGPDELTDPTPPLSDDEVNNLIGTIKNVPELLAKVLALPDNEDETPTSPTQAATLPTAPSPPLHRTNRPQQAPNTFKP